MYIAGRRDCRQNLVNTFHLISILRIVVVVAVVAIVVIVVVHFTTIAKSTLISCTAKDARNVCILATYWVKGYDRSVERENRGGYSASTDCMCC